MRRYVRLRLRLVFWVCLLTGTFVLGRYSAYGAAQRIPMSNDQFLIGVGMVKVTMETVVVSQERIIAIAQDQSRGRHTRTQAKEMIQQVVDQQETRVSAALMPFLGRNATISQDFILETDHLPDDIYHVIEFVQTKFPLLFNRYMK